MQRKDEIFLVIEIKVCEANTVTSHVGAVLQGRSESFQGIFSGLEEVENGN